MSSDDSVDLFDITFVYRITIGSVNPKSPYNDERGDRDLELMNKCLNPTKGKGRLLGKDRGFGVFQVGESRLAMEQTTFIIGFKRKPSWLEPPKL